jgi:hypothetical protein
MSTHQRKAFTTTFQLETLDDRIAPATIGFAAAAHAAFVHHHVHHHALHARAAVHAHHHARPHLAHAISAHGMSVASARLGGQMMSVAQQSLAASPMGHVASPSLMSRIAVADPPIATPSPAPAPGNPTVTSLPPNVEGILNTLYQEYQSSGGSGTFTSTLSRVIRIEGSDVGIDVHGNGDDFSALVASLQSLGMQITASDAATQTVEGLLPISQLPAAATQPQTMSITAQYLPMTF